jgi:hypothetical protein
VVDLHREMMRLTLKIAVRTLFNVEPDGIRKISQAADVLVRNMTGARMLMPSLMRFLPLPSMLEVRRAGRQLDRTVYHIIDRRRRNRQDSGDLLSMLLEARDGDGSDMDDQQVRDEVLTFLLAGHGSAPRCPVLSESGKVRSWPVAHGSLAEPAKVRAFPVRGRSSAMHWSIVGEAKIRPIILHRSRECPVDV